MSFVGLVVVGLGLLALRRHLGLAWLWVVSGVVLAGACGPNQAEVGVEGKDTVSSQTGLSWHMRSTLPLVVLVLLACGVPAAIAPLCGPGNCGGCCTAENFCLAGDTVDACGSAGATCDSCVPVAGQRCAAHACSTAGVGGGSGQGGGSGIGGGSGAGGGSGTGGGGSCGALATDSANCGACGRSCGTGVSYYHLEYEWHRTEHPAKCSASACDDAYPFSGSAGQSYTCAALCQTVGLTCKDQGGFSPSRPDLGYSLGGMHGENLPGTTYMDWSAVSCSTSIAWVAWVAGTSDWYSNTILCHCTG